MQGRIGCLSDGVDNGDLRGPALNEGTIFALLNLPLPWPPSEEVRLFSRAENGTIVALFIDRLGGFRLELSSAGTMAQSCVFCPVDYPESGLAILVARWSSRGMSLLLNGCNLPPADQHSSSVSVSSVPRQFTPAATSCLEIDPAKGKDDAERLFLGTLVDIDAKLASGGWYELLRAAGLLRQLLLDGTPLVIQINRKFRLPLVFEVLEFRSRPPIVPDHHWRNLDPSPFSGAKTESVDLDTLLRAPCLTTSGVTASVKDLIKACANAKGGTHLGTARSLAESAVVDWDEAVRVIGQEPSALAIAGLCRVVLLGLQPLVKAILAS